MEYDANPLFWRLLLWCPSLHRYSPALWASQLPLPSCQHATDGAFAGIVLVPTEALEISGDYTKYAAPGDSVIGLVVAFTPSVALPSLPAPRALNRCDRCMR